MMDKLRNNPPKNFGELQVKELRDYDRDVVTDLATGSNQIYRTSEVQCAYTLI